MFVKYFLLGMGMTWVILGSVIPRMEGFIPLGLFALLGAAVLALVQSER